MPFPITRLVNVPQICHKGKYVLFWLGFFFFFPFNCFGEFPITALPPRGTQQSTDRTVPSVLRTSVVMNVSFSPSESQQHQETGKGRAMGARSKKRDSKRRDAALGHCRAAVGRLAWPQTWLLPSRGAQRVRCPGPG